MYMNEHLPAEVLSEHLDGDLPPERRLAVERHLEGCARCRDELHLLQRLLGDLRRLPRGVPPARDLRAEIRARLEVPAPDSLPLRSDRGGASRAGTLAAIWSLRFPLAAAAVVLIVATAVVTRALSPRDPTPPTASTQVQADPVPATLVEFRQAESRYVDAIAGLQAAVERDRASLSPETVRILERNLEVIDQAIREAREALLRDPGNDGLGEMVITAYEHKLDLLRRTRAAAGT